MMKTTSGVWGLITRTCRRRLTTSRTAVCDPLIGLTDRQSVIYKNALAFGRQYLAPEALHWDETSTFPRKLMERCAEEGYGGMTVTEQLGGRAWSRAEVVCAVEALSQSCVSTTAMLTIHNACADIIARYARDPHRSIWARELCALRFMGSFCLTEPGSGSDAASLRTLAERDESTNEYVITGEKCFISGAGSSDLYVVMCRTASTAISAIVVPKDTPGLSFGAMEKKMGWRNQPTRQVHFDRVRVPISHLYVCSHYSPTDSASLYHSYVDWAKKDMDLGSLWVAWMEDA
jgi:alkylation response protein AidB-like acyl-CoA dehydrogenase